MVITTNRVPSNYNKYRSLKSKPLFRSVFFRLKIFCWWIQILTVPYFVCVIINNLWPNWKKVNLMRTLENRKKHNYLKKTTQVPSFWRRSTAGGLQSQPSAWRRSSWLSQKMRGGKRNNSVAAERQTRQQRTGFLHLSTDTTTNPLAACGAAQFKGLVT